MGASGAACPQSVLAASRNESAPFRGAPDQTGWPGSDLGRLDLQEFAGTRERDRPRLHRLRNLVHKVDVQEPVLQPRAFDLDMLGELVVALKSARGNAPMVRPRNHAQTSILSLQDGAH